jgi:hypothetical protein
MEEFSSWGEDVLSREFSFDTPSGSKNFNANYVAVPIGDGDGLLGSYTNTLNEITTIQNSFSKQVSLLRVDPKIDFDWRSDSPDSPTKADYFTIR